MVDLRLTARVCDGPRINLNIVATGYVLGLQMPESGRPSRSDQRHRTVRTRRVASPFAALLSPSLSRARSQDGPLFISAKDN